MVGCLLGPPNGLVEDCDEMGVRGTLGVEAFLDILQLAAVKSVVLLTI